MIKCATPGCSKKGKPVFLWLDFHSDSSKKSIGLFRCPECKETFRAPIPFQGTKEQVTKKLRRDFPSSGFGLPAPSAAV